VGQILLTGIQAFSGRTHAMNKVTGVSVASLDGITEAEEALFSLFRDANPYLTSPYFSAGFIKAIAPHTPGSMLARFHDGEEIVGFFAYQKRGQSLQPAGAPLADYHAAVMKAGYVPDWTRLLAAAGAKRLVFNGLIGDSGLDQAPIVKHRRIAAVPDGFEAWFATQKAGAPRYFKNLGRCTRNVAKDLPDLQFEWTDVSPPLLDWVLSLKVAQYKRSGIHDVFSCGWTRNLLLALAAQRTRSSGLWAGIYRRGEELIAAEICLIDGEDLHFWFPAYNPAYSRYSPGMLLTFDIIRHTANLGLKVFDFGSGGEAYKSPMTIDGPLCCEGQVGRALTLPIKNDRLQRAWLSLWRRAHIVQACEVSLTGQIKACMRLIEWAEIKIRKRLATRPQRPAA
jgi:CelD/BcsL family acetyltransferase involved in cellulose biosynthesis